MWSLPSRSSFRRSSSVQREFILLLFLFCTWTITIIFIKEGELKLSVTRFHIYRIKRSATGDKRHTIHPTTTKLQRLTPSLFRNKIQFANFFCCVCLSEDERIHYGNDNNNEEGYNCNWGGRKVRVVMLHMRRPNVVLNGKFAEVPMHDNKGWRHGHVGNPKFVCIGILYG